VNRELTSRAQPTPTVAIRPRPYAPDRRLCYGSLWGFYTLMLLIGSITCVATASTGLGIVMLIVATMTGVYTYRIWTWRARRLWLLMLI
jgi:hypothetical protein